MLGMGHEAEHVASLVDDPCDVPERAVHVRRVAEDELAASGELDELALVRMPCAFAVLHGKNELLTGLTAACEHAVRGLDAHHGVLADELELRVGPESPRKQPGLAQDLKTVADPEHGASRGGESADRIHHRSDARDRAAPQVVAVRETAREHDCSGRSGKLLLVVPDQNRDGAQRPERPGGVSVVVRARELEDGDDGTVGHEPGNSMSTLSINGFARSSEHIRSTCCRANAGSTASSSTSITRPTRTLPTSKPSFRNEP